jgi:hypothetical protein
VIAAERNMPDLRKRGGRLARQVLGWPGTSLGRVALGLAGVFVVATLIFLYMSAMGETGGDAFFDNPRLAVPIMVALVAGMASGVASGIAILRREERSIVTGLTLALGVFVAWFTVAVVLFP